jgi:GTP-binding protein HflX
LTIDEDDLMTEKHQDTIPSRVEVHLDGSSREENALFISATNKENFEELRERLYEVVREIHITRFPYNKFLYPDYKDAVEKEDEDEQEEEILE